MNLPFKTLPDLIKHFDSEEKCRDFIEKMRWPTGNIICPICGTNKAYRNGDMITYKCRKDDCKARFSVTVGTMMENTKLSLQKWFAAIWLITNHKKGISSCQLARDLGIGQKAAWFLNHRIREMVADKSPELLDHIVEVDETYVGGKWANMKKTKRKEVQEKNIDTKTAVMGMLQRDGKVKMTIIGNDTFKDVARKHISKNAVIVTDQHTGYRGLENEFAGHVFVNHSQLEFKNGNYWTNGIEGYFGLFKRSILGIYHQVSVKHLQRYCNEMSYRYNTRKAKDNLRFVDVMGKTEGRLRYVDLVGKK
jgi:transposase-like protein